MNEESSPADRNTVMTDIIQALEQRGYSIDGVACRTGRPDRSAFPVVSATGCRAIAKLYPKNNGQAAFENMQRLWCSDFGAQRKPPRMPKPIEYMPEASILITQRVDGQPLVEFPAIGTDVLRGSIALLVDLHRSDVQPMTRRTAKKLVRSVQRKAARIAEVAPRYTPAISEVLQALERTKVGDTQLVPSHGDFSPRNILVGSSRLPLSSVEAPLPAMGRSCQGCRLFGRVVLGGLRSTWPGRRLGSPAPRCQRLCGDAS